jgi:dihydroxyacetone kinase
MTRIFFSGLGKALRDQKASGASSTTPEVWAKASAEALEILYKCQSSNIHLRLRLMADTRARPPSRTLVDPLEAFIQSLPSKGLSGAADDAQAAADKTKELVAKAGRGAYVNQEDLKKREVPDPGAWGIWRLVDGLRGYQAK